MPSQIIIYQQEKQIFCLSFDNNQRLQQVIYDDINQQIGTIYLAKVISLNSKNHTAFIEYTNGQTGFLNYNPRHVNIQVGSKLVAQLEWIGNSEKLPKFGYNIKLIGKYVILHRLGKGLRFSHQLDNQLIKTLTQEFAKYSNYNLTFRTKVQSCDDMNLIIHEVEQLITQYEQIMNKANQLNPSLELLHGYYNYNLYLNSLNNINETTLVTNSKTIYNGLIDLRAQLNEVLAIEINQLIDIPNNPMITLHQLSGINLFDIDGNNQALSAFKTNYLVLDDIIRMIMIKDLTGIILIDMIKNMSVENEQTIYSKFIQQLKSHDWRNCQILGFTKAGIFEIIRPK